MKDFLDFLSKPAIVIEWDEPERKQIKKSRKLITAEYKLLR